MAVARFTVDALPFDKCPDNTSVTGITDTSEAQLDMAIDEKPSRNEDEYFARLDADLMKERRARLDAERLKQERSVHYNKCPKCGAELTERDHHGVKIDVCSECGGVWLDKGELELLGEVDKRSSGFIQSIFGFGR